MDHGVRMRTAHHFSLLIYFVFYVIFFQNTLTSKQLSFLILLISILGLLIIQSCTKIPGGLSTTIKGKVTKFSTFGAFVEIAPKIRGLCHISEFESKEEMEKQLEIGKTYDFKVLSIEPKEHRMSLKLIK